MQKPKYCSHNNHNYLFQIAVVFFNCTFYNPKLILFQKFLLKKNLLTHMKRIHESEGKGATFKCSVCPKAFYYDNDRVIFIFNIKHTQNNHSYLQPFCVSFKYRRIGVPTQGSYVVYFDQRTHACAWVCIVENDKKHSKVPLKLLCESCIIS